MTGKITLSEDDAADGVVVEADLLGHLLGIAPGEVQQRIRERAIVVRCERGEGADQGRYRLFFRYQSRRACIISDAAGRVLQRWVVDFHPTEPFERSA